MTATAAPPLDNKKRGNGGIDSVLNGALLVTSSVP
jgi:hypothetical protein